MRIFFLVHAPLRSAIITALLFVLLIGPGSSAVQSPAEYFSTWGLSPAYLQEKTRGIGERIKFSLSSTEYQLIARVLDRFQGAPSQWRQEWADGSIQFERSYANECQEQCRPVRMRGKIIQVIRVAAPDDVAVIAKWKEIFAVQFQLDNAGKAWVIVPNLPDGLPVESNLNEKGGASAILLHVPDSGSDQQVDIPVLAVAPRLRWWPQTPLGKIGMDYGLFTSVDDGVPLTASDAEAFYACLSASENQKEIPDDPLLDDASLVSLLNPSSDWLTMHRGDQIVLRGTARRITKVLVDPGQDQEKLGRDHYWEIFVFVTTPLLQIGNNFQNTYPIVYCCTELPKGLPTGEQVNEPVEVAGFIFKRYRYVTRRLNHQLNGTRQGRPQESPLLIGKSLSWLPSKKPLRFPGGMTWLPAITAFALIGWIMKGFFQSRCRERLTDTLPDQIQLP